jgi:hypothetical protein
MQLWSATLSYPDRNVSAYFYEYRPDIASILTAAGQPSGPFWSHNPPENVDAVNIYNLVRSEAIRNYDAALNPEIEQRLSDGSRAWCWDVDIQAKTVVGSNSTWLVTKRASSDSATVRYWKVDSGGIYTGGILSGWGAVGGEWDVDGIVYDGAVYKGLNRYIVEP